MAKTKKTDEELRCKRIKLQRRRNKLQRKLDVIKEIFVSREKQQWDPKVNEQVDALVDGGWKAAMIVSDTKDKEWAEVHVFGDGKNTSTFAKFETPGSMIQLENFNSNTLEPGQFVEVYSMSGIRNARVIGIDKERTCDDAGYKVVRIAYLDDNSIRPISSSLLYPNGWHKYN